MLGRDVYGAVEPCDRPAVEGETGEHVLVSQRSKELVLIDKRLAVEDDAAAVVEVQLQQVVAHDAGGSDPFQSVCLFHIVSIKWVNLCQRLAVFHTLPVLHQLVLVQVEPVEDEVQRCFLAANLRKDSDNKMFFAEKIAEKLQEIDVGEIDVGGFCH